MQPMGQAVNTAESVHPKLTTVKTTLYELIEAIIEEVQPGEDRLVVETMLHLLDTGTAGFPGKAFKVESS